MQDSPLIITFVLVLMQFLLGILANSIIVVVNGIGLIKQKKMAPLDLLLSCLALSRICLQVTILHFCLTVLSLTDLFMLSRNFVTYLFVSESELWLATWLGVFYCAKIANVSHPFFFWLKMRITKLVPWLILGSLLFASATCVLHSNYVWIISQNFSVAFVFKNIVSPVKEKFALQFFLLTVEVSIPLLIFLAAGLLLVFSLGRHTQQMRNVAAGAGDTPRSASIQAMLSVLSFFILYFSRFTAPALLSLENFQFGSLNVLFFALMFGTYPSAHSVILILGNPKLKQNAKKFFLHRKCCQ
ncbi:taste receptor type 2 member 1 [Nycticebus coucang]|uniref:taste receptor type 2 member 1 n=1 Tax=Nycticebus coucang TaxID=9470 RepID=UPI00234DFD46|nr:taste receptor type 2 member 1 [Nycticebus coucang]